MAIDTLGFCKYLEEHGVDRSIAEAHAEAANRFLFPELATKADIAALRTDVAALRTDMAALRTELKADIVEVKADMTMRAVAIVGVLDALLFALLKLT